MLTYPSRTTTQSRAHAGLPLTIICGLFSKPSLVSGELLFNLHWPYLKIPRVEVVLGKASGPCLLDHRLWSVVVDSPATPQSSVPYKARQSPISSLLAALRCFPSFSGCFRTISHFTACSSSSFVPNSYRTFVDLLPLQITPTILTISVTRTADRRYVIVSNHFGNSFNPSSSLDRYVLFCFVTAAVIPFTELFIFNTLAADVIYYLVLPYHICPLFQHLQ